MKTRFTTLDICAVLSEINTKLVGMRLANVYDINNKTYLLKLAKPDTKAMLLMESGIRLHISEFDWPKNMMPSGFSMKLRKHLKGRRLVHAKQLGIDRIVDMQFGSDEAAFHVILELYDRGNIILTDHKYMILNLLRYRKEKQSTTNKGDSSKKDEDAEVRFAVHETYPVDSAKKPSPLDEIEGKLTEMLRNSKKGDVLKRVLNPYLPYGAACIEHCLLCTGFPPNATVGKGFDITEENIEKLLSGLRQGESLLSSLSQDSAKGFVIQKQEKKADGSTVLANIEFHPFLFMQHKECPRSELESFNKAVDEFFGNLESQKADLKIVQLEKSAQKKLDNIKKDHEQRLATLEKQQDSDIYKAQVIEENLALVEQAIRVVRTAIANQIDWDEIHNLIKDAQASGDPVALAISGLNLQSNEFTMTLSEQNEDSESEESDSSDDEKSKKTAKKKPKGVKVTIDLGLSAYGNTKKYYSKKKHASQKQQKIVESSEKAYKSAEKKMKQTFEEANKIHNIQKARKTFWFEKFIWFISSENYLVIGGRDAQQNEILVKKYLTEHDVYVHADLHGATSCIVKNHGKEEIPPKTLNEAGTMAICHSAAWSAKVVTSAWWVHSHQVSKTAPSGEYLTTGSFLIRGKKNYLPPSNLIYGFGILFKVDETCIHKHQDERKVISINSVQSEDSESVTAESLSSELDTELQIDSDGGATDDEEDEENKITENEFSMTTSVKIEEKSVISEAVNSSDGGDVASSSEQSLLASQQLDSTEESESFVGEASAMCHHTEDATTATDERTIGYDCPNKEDVEFADKQKDVEAKPEPETVDESDDGPESAVVPTIDFPDTNVKITFDIKKDKETAAEAQKNGQRSGSKTSQQRHKHTDNTEMTGARRTNSESNRNQNSGGDSHRGDTQPKRGQKHKMKKLKGKYKDQDEEERAMKMELLQQSQSQKARDRKAKKNKVAAKQASKSGSAKSSQQQRRPQKQQQPKLKEGDDGYDSEEERAKVLENEHLNKESSGILSSLTGCPLVDDILLFALPVCAPYNTMHNYKFKVKLTPGNTKKGKGAKTALSLFQNLKETTAPEKDHLRSIKDHDLARNIPGKVKVSSTNQQLQRRKK